MLKKQPTKTKEESIDKYIAEFPAETKKILTKIRKIVRELAPKAEETIKYGIPTFVLHENLVHFAAYAKHIGFYPTPSVIEHFAKELGGYKKAKGSVQFPLDTPMPYELIARMVKFRVKQVSKK
jgi:uncharacterized protein YdhG (YjbR/CyaY superfamily)